MRFRKLRIAWSVGCGIFCVLLIVMWIRSYWWGDCYTIPINNNWICCSDLRGSIVLTCFDATKRTDISAGYSWGRASHQRLDEHIPVHFYGFCLKDSEAGFGLAIPSWFLIVTSIGFAVAPWLSWQRFTTRTLFLATTLAATLLGLSVWLSRQT